MILRNRDGADWFMFWFQIMTTTIILTCILIITIATVFQKYDLSVLVANTVKETLCQILSSARSFK